MIFKRVINLGILDFTYILKFHRHFYFVLIFERMTMFLLEDRFVCLWFKLILNRSAQGYHKDFFWAESKQNGNSIFVEIALDRFAQFTWYFNLIEKLRVVRAFWSQIAAVKNSSDEKIIFSFDVFHSKSNALIAMEVPEVWISWFEIEKTTVCEGFDLRKHLGNGFRIVFIEVTAAKFNPFLNDANKTSIFDW